MKWIGRLALALLSLLVLARAASAQPYEQPAYEPAHVEGQGYAYGYEAGSQSTRYDARSYQSNRYGERGEQASAGSQSSYEYEYGYGAAYAYRSGDEAEAYDQEYVVAESCDWTRPADPRDPWACPPGWGVVTLPGSFFYGGGGVGPEYIAGGGGGGGGYAYAGAGASAFAYAGASARVSIGFRGGGKGGHKPGKRGGCGCR